MRPMHLWHTKSFGFWMCTPASVQIPAPVPPTPSFHCVSQLCSPPLHPIPTLPPTPTLTTPVVRWPLGGYIRSAICTLYAHCGILKALAAGSGEHGTVGDEVSHYIWPNMLPPPQSGSPCPYLGHTENLGWCVGGTRGGG